MRKKSNLKYQQKHNTKNLPSGTKLLKQAKKHRIGLSGSSGIVGDYFRNLSIEKNLEKVNV